MKNFDNIENDGTLFYDNITKNIFVKSENNENVHYIVNENLKCSCPAFKYCKNKKNPMTARDANLNFPGRKFHC